MFLRKNPMTPARLQANRRNAQKSTGPRTARGKSQSRLNRLRSGGRSRLYGDLLKALVDAPPGRVFESARAILTPAQMAHPLFADLVETFCEAESGVALRYGRLPPPKDA
ncbi:MAG TPA: hypothetical protein VN776_02030 [Terracidiphilus sp.]|nr:hypothetical protein [Terracidiphilus sp.]